MSTNTKTKKPATKKTPAKKAPVKKTTAKKPIAKKAPAKKPVTPAPVAKPAAVTEKPVAPETTKAPETVVVARPTQASPWMDEYEKEYTDYAELMADVKDMEAHSRWYPAVQSKNIRVNPLEAPLFARTVAQATGMDEEQAEYTATYGSKLYLTMPDGSTKRLDRCGFDSLTGRACLFGSALGRMNPDTLSQVLNMALDVAKGEALVLERYGAIAALHSDGSDGYCVMPIPTVMDITTREVTKRCGKMTFKRGGNSHSYTYALWHLPEVQEKLALKYQEAMLTSGRQFHYDANKLMPAVRLSTSDTAVSSVILRPMFWTGHAYVQFAESISVKHTRRVSAKDGLSLYEEKVSDELYTRLNDMVEAAAAMLKIDVYNPTNAVIGICNKFRIPKKWGNKALENIDVWMVNATSLTAHDIYMALNEAIAEAGDPIELGDKLCALANPKFDWAAIDVGGTVAWAN